MLKKEFDEIYRTYASDIYNFILKLSGNETISMDILQDTMMKAVMSADKFKGNCSVKTYLCTIARNEYYNYLKKSENKNVPLDVVTDRSDDDNSPEILLTDSDQAMQIHELLHLLEEPYKEIFTLKVFADLTYKDIGNIFGKNENWARVTYFRAKERIIKLMNEREFDNEV